MFSGSRPDVLVAIKSQLGNVEQSITMEIQQLRLNLNQLQVENEGLRAALSNNGMTSRAKVPMSEFSGEDSFRARWLCSENDQNLEASLADVVLTPTVEPTIEEEIVMEGQVPQPRVPMGKKQQTTRAVLPDMSPGDTEEFPEEQQDLNGETHQSNGNNNTKTETLEKDGVMGMISFEDFDEIEKKATEDEAAGPHASRNRQSRLVEVMPPLEQPKGIAGRIITHPVFDSVCAVMIILNSLLIGARTEYLTSNDEEAGWMAVCGYLCSVFFFVELVLRLVHTRMSFFTSENKMWNLFDLLLVIFSIADVVMAIVLDGDGAGSIGSTMKTVKMLRIIRIFRVFRFFSELGMLAMMITESFQSLAWALVMMVLIIYVFAICFTQSTTDYLIQKSDGGELEEIDIKLRGYFGNLSFSTDTLIQAMLGGTSWGEFAAPVSKIGWAAYSLFYFYIFFTMFAVLNIVTGVFVDNALQATKGQREFLVEQQRVQKEKTLQEMRELFKDMDQDGSGSISASEIKECMNDPKMGGYFHMLEIEIDDSERLFSLLDDDGSGEVSIDEFFDGCLRLKGLAKSIDLYQALANIKQMHDSLDKIPELIEKIPLSLEKLNSLFTDA
jgi:hypothetical protein